MVQYVCGPIGLKNNLAYSRACKPGQMVDGKTTRGPPQKNAKLHLFPASYDVSINAKD